MAYELVFGKVFAMKLNLRYKYNLRQIIQLQ
jgi:hypothetical protein